MHFVLLICLMALIVEGHVSAKSGQSTEKPNYGTVMGDAANPGEWSMYSPTHVSGPRVGEYSELKGHEWQLPIAQPVFPYASQQDHNINIGGTVYDQAIVREDMRAVNFERPVYLERAETSQSSSVSTLRKQLNHEDKFEGDEEDEEEDEEEEETSGFVNPDDHVYKSTVSNDPSITISSTIKDVHLGDLMSGHIIPMVYTDNEIARAATTWSDEWEFCGGIAEVKCNYGLTCLLRGVNTGTCVQDPSDKFEWDLENVEEGKWCGGMQDDGAECADGLTCYLQAPDAGKCVSEDDLTSSDGSDEESDKE